MQQLHLEIKSINEEGYFEGLLSPYGNEDQTGDIVEPGAYKKTLIENRYKVVLLWQHDTKQPIGSLELEDRPEGLWCKGQLLMGLQKAQEAYLCIKAGIIKGLSIGYSSVKDFVEKGIRHLKEIKLYEGSLVTFPANTDALISFVKNRRGGETKDDFNEELSDVQLMDSGWQMFCALNMSLSSLTWNSELSADEKVTAAAAYIRQFSEAYLVYLPLFLAMLAEDYGGMEMMAIRQKIEEKASKKEGRVISAYNMDKLSAARDHMKSAHEIVSALVDNQAVDETTPKGAGPLSTSQSQAAAISQPEPVFDHSWGKSFTDAVKEKLGVN